MGALLVLRPHRIGARVLKSNPSRLHRVPVGRDRRWATDRDRINPTKHMICRFKAGDLLRKPLPPRSCPQKLPTVSGCLEEGESIGSPRVWSKCGDNSWSARTVIARQATISLFLFPQDVAACARRVLSGCSSSRCAPRVGPVRCRSRAPGHVARQGSVCSAPQSLSFFPSCCSVRKARAFRTFIEST